MTVEIIIRDSEGNIKIHKTSDNIFQPLEWKSPFEMPLVEGKYSLWRFVYVPTATLSLPREEQKVA